MKDIRVDELLQKRILTNLKIKKRQKEKEGKEKEGGESEEDEEEETYESYKKRIVAAQGYRAANEFQIEEDKVN